MSKNTVITTVTPLPAGVTRQIVLDFLHDHEEMIDSNPLVKERHPIPTPSHAAADERHCQWFSVTDKISYFPGLAGDVTYTCAFRHLATGLQTHCYAPAGLSRSKPRVKTTRTQYQPSKSLTWYNSQPSATNGPLEAVCPVNLRSLSSPASVHRQQDSTSARTSTFAAT